MRVSTNFQPDVLAGIEQSQAALATALQQVSTLQRVNKPSDDPTASALVLQDIAASNNVDQYTKNANTALSQTQTADSAISSIVSLLTRAVTLGTQAANGTNTAANRQSVATEVQGILDSVVSNANATYQGIAVFAGTAATATAFVADSNSSTGYTYQGDTSANQVQVGDSLEVQVSVSGADLFTNSSASVLGSLSALAGALQSNSTTAVATATASVTAALNFLSAQHSTFGNAINQLNAQESFLGQEKVTLSAEANHLVGVDEATAAENLVQAQSHNSAVLAAAAKVLPTTLFDYLT